MRNRLHLISGKQTIDLAVNYRGTKVVVEVDGREYTSILLHEGVTVHTMGVPKQGLREPGDEEDVYEIAVFSCKRTGLFPFLRVTLLNVSKNGRPVHAEFTRKNT